MRNRLLRLCAVAALICGAGRAVAQDSGNLRYEKQTTFSPNDYLLKSREARDPVFDRYQTVDLGVDLGIGADCGHVDFKSTLQSTLQNVLNADYFGRIGETIKDNSLLLSVCYASPTWCAILKHSQLSAGLMTQFRLDQCALVDRYTDKRVDDFYAERQSCVHKKIEENGGNLDAAMDSCRNFWDADLASWSGGDGKSESNKLVESSAKWAGYQGDRSDDSLDLLKSLVGDTVISRGRVSVEYGKRGAPLTPEKHLQELREGAHAKLCQNLVVRVASARGNEPITRTVSDRDLKEINGATDGALVDRQTIESLAYMPELQRGEACRKLSDAVAMTTMTKDMDRSLDILTVSAQNPHLPPHRKDELEEKRRTLKESVEITMELQRQRNEPLNRVVSEINSEGQRYRGQVSDRVLSTGAAAHQDRAVRATLFDCADRIMCEEQ